MTQLADYRHTMESCNHCGQCKWLLGPKTRGWRFAEICPIHAQFHFDAYSGQGLINIARELLEGRLQYEPGLIDLIYSCTTCGACDVNCKSVRDMEVLETILAMRAKCVEDGQGALPAHREMAERIEKNHNIYGHDHSKRQDWLTDEIKVSAESPVAYFVGCSASYMHTDIARNTARILNACGVDFTVLGGAEYCCGNPLWQTGQREAAARQVEHNLAVMRERGIKTVITSCAECFGALRNIYPRYSEPDFEVRHIAEVARDALREGYLNFQRPVDLKVTYHDPCHLGRCSEPYVPWQGEIRAFGLHVPPKQWRRGTNGVYDAPREVLRAIPGLELREMTRNEENAYCCGAGGGVRSAFPEQARETALDRIEEAASTGAAAVVSACPFCRSNLEDALTAEAQTMKYFDLTELITRAI
jgi:Fe-S oxidoreductase